MPIHNPIPPLTGLDTCVRSRNPARTRAARVRIARLGTSAGGAVQARDHETLSFEIDVP